MAQSPINAGAIPVPSLDAGVLQLDAGWLREDAGKIRTHGADIKSTWAGLAAVYHAPEDATLLSAMDPVAINTDAFATDTEQVASILSTFAAEAGPLVDTLSSTQASASAFGAKVSGNDKWDHDGDLVKQNNALVHTVNTTIVAFQAAERKAANAIETLIGGHTFHAVDPNSKTQDKYAYGYSSIPDNAKTPWGADVSKKDGCLKSSLTHVGHFFEGVGEGLWGMVKGVGTLAWDAVGGGGWDKFKQAWEGIGFLATLVVPGGTAVGMAIWGPKGYGQRLEAMGKGLVDWDEWKTDPAKALGNTVANVGTLFIPGAGEVGAAADGAKGASLAADAGRAADLAGDAGKASNGLARAGELTKAGLQTFGKLTDPFHYVSQLPKIVDVAKGLGIKIPDFSGLVGHDSSVVSHLGGDGGHLGSHEPVTVGAGHDVGSGGTHDTGSGSTHDAGTGNTHDAGTGGTHDAGTGGTHDTGTGGTHDAGTGGTHDTGGNHETGGTHDGQAGQHEWHDENGKRHFEGDPPNTSRDVNGALHDSAGHFTHDPNAHTGVDVHAVKGDTHVVTDHHPGHEAQVADRAATQAQHTTDLGNRNQIIAELKHEGVTVDPAKLSSTQLDRTISRLSDSEAAHANPAVLDHLDDLRSASEAENRSLAALKSQSEHLGMTAAHDVVTADGSHVIVGEDAARAGRPGELDTIGLSHDGHTITVVEAKGGNSTLGSRMVGDVRAEQGSTTYLNDLLHRDPRFADYLHDHPEFASRFAHGDVHVDYKLVEARANGAVRVTDFHLDGDGLHLGDLGPRDAVASHVGAGHADATSAHPVDGHPVDGHPVDGHPAPDAARDNSFLAPHHTSDAPPPPTHVGLADGSTHEVTYSNAHLHALPSSSPALTEALARHSITPEHLGELIRTPHADLTPHEVAVLKDVRQSVPDIRAGVNGEGGETMSKALNAQTGDDLLAHRVQYPENSVQGFVARAGDMAHVHGVADQRDALALTYIDRHGDPAFPIDASHSYSLRYTTADPRVPDVPLSHEFGGTYDADPPYTGNGFTASEHHLVPEFRYERPVTAQPGAEMWRVNADGSEELAGVLNKQGEWVPTK